MDEVDCWRTERGSLFQEVGPETEKARGPKVLSLVRGVRRIVRYKNISQPQAFWGISIMSNISKRQHEQEGVQKLEITLTKSIFVQKLATKRRPKSRKPTVTVFKP